MKKVKPTVIFLGKLLVSGGLLAFFLSQIDFTFFLRTIVSADLFYIGLALVIYLVSQVIAAVRWTVLSRPLGFNLPFTEMMIYYFIGMFFNLFAPSTVGGDISKIVYLTRSGRERGDNSWTAATLHASIAVLADRAIGMLVLIWLGAAGLLLFPAYGVPFAVRGTVIALALGLAVGALAVPLLTRVLPENGHPLISKLGVALRSYRSDFQVIPQAITFSVAIHLIQAWIHYIMGQALMIEIPFSYCIIVYPLVGTFAALPVSFNGIGLRESGYLFLLGMIGINSEKAIAFGLLLFLIVALDSLLGGLLFLLKKSSKASATVTKAIL